MRPTAQGNSFETGANPLATLSHSYPLITLSEVDRRYSQFLALFIRQTTQTRTLLPAIQSVATVARNTF
jgi:hypothetical protein